MNNLITIQETASYLRISLSTLYRWVHQKKIKHIKLGSRVMFKKEDIEEFIKSKTINTE